MLSDKATYPALLGMERSREIAAELISEAKKALESWEPEAKAPLMALADYIHSRTN